MFRSGDWLHNDVTYPHEKKGDGGVRKMILILNYCVCPDNPPELNLATPKPAHMRTLGIASSRWLGIKEWRFSLVIMPGSQQTEGGPWSAALREKESQKEWSPEGRKSCPGQTPAGVAQDLTTDQGPTQRPKLLGADGGQRSLKPCCTGHRVVTVPLG